MEGEIVNRVAANTKLVTIDLEELYPSGKRVLLDIKDWLYEGLILREKDFRNQVATHSWEQYKNAYVALFCSTDAIIPGWAYLLLTSSLIPYAQKVVVGSLNELEFSLYQDLIQARDWSYTKDKSVIIKGCTNKPIPQAAYVLLIQEIQSFAKSISYGEACSSVPLFKRKKQL